MEDNTAVIRMKRDFDAFIHGTGSKSTPMFRLDQSDISNDSHLEQSSVSSLSVKSLLDKEKENKSKEAEVIALRSQVTKLKLELSSLQTSNKRVKIDLEKDCELMQMEREQEVEKVVEMKAQLQYIADKEKQTREELLECHKELERRKASYEEKINMFRKEKIHLEQELQEAKKKAWEKLTGVKNELVRTTEELNICRQELDDTKSQLVLQLRHSSDLESHLKELEDYKNKAAIAEQKVKEFELRISSMEEDEKVIKAMKSQLTSFEELERENRKLSVENSYLKEIQENILLLKEQNESLKGKLDRSEQRMSDFSKLQIECEDMKLRLEKWENADKGKSKVQSPEEMSKRIAELQRTEALMLAKQGQMQSSMTSCESELRVVKGECQDLKTELIREKQKVQQQADFIKRLQKKLLLVTKERDGYKSIIDSYESEVTVNIQAGTSTHIQQLEEGIGGYKKQIQFQEEELAKSAEQLSESRRQNIQFEKRIRELEQATHANQFSQCDQEIILQLREKIAGLEKELEAKEEKVLVLEARIEQRRLQGDYDPTTTKVLHFKMNPVKIAQNQRTEEIKALQEENERLKKRLQILEESGGKVEDLTVQVEQKLQEPGSAKDIEEMKTQLNSAKLKNERLMEAFKKTSQEFREVCYRLMGYKIDIPCTNQYRLTSMYSESPNHFLLFQQSSSGEIQMLETEFSTSLKDHIDMYLARYDSIPAFLSSVTLDLVSRQTISIG
ncbi:hypothetical protein CHS0354_019049 [Potamilus streckersoni]|uniref:Mitotic spindle assembly checkpoint protein MAD1 n=1 Tax=Potamilus streckersoni TaxID=2493646 RepID=A0AAE0SIW8_9BIVA|nr:hypothetical protein CHS0354_019049 [Potamilus streckersoni]